MKLNKVVIGVRFNRRRFSQLSNNGELIDCLFDYVVKEKKFGEDFFTMFTSSSAPDNIFTSIQSSDKKNVITFKPEEVAYIREAESKESALNLDKVIEEFTDLWKQANKLLDFQPIRRIGLVGEYLIKTESEQIPHFLTDKLTRVPAPDNSRRFQLSFEKRQVENISLFDEKTSSYLNSIYTIYPSYNDRDCPYEGFINANLDFQKYYNPANKNAVNEIKVIRNNFKAEKDDFKGWLTELGLVNG